MTKQTDKTHKALGKGLAALLPQRPTQAPPPPSAPPSPAPDLTHTVHSIPIEEIRPNPVQPRSNFDPDRLRELADSIRANGIIQPLIVRMVAGSYELVAGERRLRASKVAGLTHVPVLVQELAEERLLEIALIENIQREDLNPIETAQAFEKLVQEHGLSHEEIGRRTGKDRTTVTNMLRLLKLPADVQILLAERRLSMGHARALLGLQNDNEIIDLANRAAAQGFSVRQVERTVSQLTSQREEAPSEAKPQDPNVKAAVVALEEALGTRVRIVEKTDQKGRIEIDYYSQDDLDRIYNLIVQERGER